MGASRGMAEVAPATAVTESQQVPRGGRPDARASAPRPGIRGLVFDLEDVLYDATLGRRWMLQLLARMGLKRDYRTFYRAWDHEFLVDVQRGRREYAEAFQAFLLAQGFSWAQIDEVQAASRLHCQELESGVRPLPGVVATIDELAARGVSMAVLADCAHSASELAGKLELLGLRGRFQAVLTSFELEETKPALRCYQAALQGLNLTTEEALYVGHDSRDLVGAAAAGLRTAAFNHDADARADHYLARLEELLEIVPGDGGLIP